MICELYFCEPVKTSRLKYLELFDKIFHYDEGNVYSGFLDVNVHRIKLVSVVTDLRAQLSYMLQCASCLSRSTGNFAICGA